VKYPLRYRDAVSFGHASSVLVAMVTVFMPLLAYRDYPSVYGQSPAMKLLLLATLGAAAAFALFVDRRARWVATGSGLVAGFCGVGLFLLNPAFLASPLQLVTPNGWPMWVALLGSTPGFLLFWFLRRTAAGAQ
jgi:hypothetical protein